MVQIKESTEEEKREMYMKLTKTELITMLIECNRILDNISESQKLIFTGSGKHDLYGGTG